MPTHIEVLCGDYRVVVETNQAAIEADRKFLEREGSVNFYSLYRWAEAPDRPGPNRRAGDRVVLLPAARACRGRSGVTCGPRSRCAEPVGPAYAAPIKAAISRSPITSTSSEIGYRSSPAQTTNVRSGRTSSRAW